VEGAALADELAVVVDRRLGAVERAVHRSVLDAAHAEVERGVPGGAELVRVGMAAELVDAVLGEADPAAGGGDRAGLCQRFDESALDVGLPAVRAVAQARDRGEVDRKSTRLNSSHVKISYAVFCLKKKT